MLVPITGPEDPGDYDGYPHHSSRSLWGCFGDRIVELPNSTITNPGIWCDRRWQLRSDQTL